MTDRMLSLAAFEFLVLAILGSLAWILLPDAIVVCTGGLLGPECVAWWTFGFCGAACILGWLSFRRHLGKVAAIGGTLLVVAYFGWLAYESPPPSIQIIETEPATAFDENLGSRHKR